MALNIAGLVCIIILYLLMLALGLWAAYRKKEEKHEKRTEIMIVARRDIGLVLGTLTMIATCIGGGVINGTAEGVYMPEVGFLWTFTPFVLGLGMVINGLVMSKKFRSSEYLTMLDPFQNKYGKFVGAFFYIPACCGELFYSASILSALGSTVAVIIGIDVKAAIIASSCIAVFYTLIGGFYSVAYTDAAQLFCMLFGLYLALPFAMTHPATESISDTAYMNVQMNATGWIGQWDWRFTASWIDQVLFWVLGAIPWQAYYQRVLSTTSPETGYRVSLIAAFCFTFLVIPPVLFGATAASTDWNQTAYGLPTPYERGDSAFILPIVLQYLTPIPVAVVGLAAICTAVMSSMDSTLLSASSMFTNNIYRKIIRKNASDTELLWGLRLCIIMFGTGACAIAIAFKTVLGLLSLCVDLIYVIVFPQLIGVMFLDVNSYGAIVALVLAIILRIGAGEATFGLEPFIRFPYGNNMFPFRTFIMLCSGITLVVISYAAKYLFESGMLKPHYDVLSCKLANGGKSRSTKRSDKGQGILVEYHLAK